MSTNQAVEAAQMIDEIEDDALQNDEPLTVDQRIAVASIRATLASIETVAAQVEATQAQTALLARNADNAERMCNLLEASTTPPPSGAGEGGGR